MGGNVGFCLFVLFIIISFFAIKENFVSFLGRYLLNFCLFSSNDLFFFFVFVVEKHDPI